MVFPSVADAAETADVAELLRAGRYDEATLRAADVLGDDLGRFCQAMLGPGDDVAAVVTESLLVLRAALPDLDPSALRPYLFGSAYRRCARRLQAQSTATRREALRVQRPDDPPLPPEREAARRLARRMRLRLEQVGPRARAAGLLRYVARLGYADIGVVCGMDAEEAMRQCGRALLLLREADDVEPGHGR